MTTPPIAADDSLAPADPDAVIAVLAPSPARRVMAVFVLGATGGLLLWVALASPPSSLGWRIYLLVFGGACLWITWRLWQATQRQVRLTGRGLFDSEGTLLARLEDIAKVDRSTFAFKPSNGFLVRLHRAGPRGWAPGLWWRLGRSLGLGGVTPGAQGRFMAEMLAGLIAERAARAADADPARRL